MSYFCIDISFASHCIIITTPAPDMCNIFGQYSMDPLTDYAAQTIWTNAIDDETITELMRIVCYDQPIYDDECLEEDEWLGLTLDVDRSTPVLTNVRPMYDQAAILIQDNDSKLQLMLFDIIILKFSSA